MLETATRVKMSVFVMWITTVVCGLLKLFYFCNFWIIFHFFGLIFFPSRINGRQLIIVDCLLMFRFDCKMES